MLDITTPDPYSLREGRKDIIIDMLQRGETERLTEDGRKFRLRHYAVVTVTEKDGWAEFPVKVIKKEGTTSEDRPCLQFGNILDCL